MGQISQNALDLRLKVRPPPGMSAWEPFDISQPRKAESSFAALSWRWTALEPHSTHLHLCVPAPVLPFVFMRAPQTGHSFVFTSTSGIGLFLLDS